jgi:hypothetical protein
MKVWCQNFIHNYLLGVELFSNVLTAMDSYDLILSEVWISMINLVPTRFHPRFIRTWVQSSSFGIFLVPYSFYKIVWVLEHKKLKLQGRHFVSKFWIQIDKFNECYLDLELKFWMIFNYQNFIHQFLFQFQLFQNDSWCSGLLTLKTLW